MASQRQVVDVLNADIYRLATGWWYEVGCVTGQAYAAHLETLCDCCCASPGQRRNDLDLQVLDTNRAAYEVHTPLFVEVLSLLALLWSKGSHRAHLIRWDRREEQQQSSRRPPRRCVAYDVCPETLDPGGRHHRRRLYPLA